MRGSRNHGLLTWPVWVAAMVVGSVAWAAEGDGGIELLDPAAEAAFYDGNARLDAGDAAGALASFDRALEIAPDFYRVHLYRARALIVLEDPLGALKALDAFERQAYTAAERREAIELREEAARLAEIPPPEAPIAPPDDQPPGEDPTGEDPTGEAAVGDPPAVDGSAGDELVVASDEPGRELYRAVYLGLEGGYALTRGEMSWNWGLVQLRVEVRLRRGLSLRSQVGLGLQEDADVLYGVVPAALGVTWRARVHPRPFVDAHLLLIAYRDDTALDGAPVNDDARSPGVGGGAGVGLEFDLVKRDRFGLALAPQVQVGWADVLLLQGGVSIRASFGGGAGDRDTGS